MKLLKVAALFGLAFFCSETYAIKVNTLPDDRPALTTEDDIQGHEKARAEAAKVKKNPQAKLLNQIQDKLEAINEGMSFGVSFSQRERNERARLDCSWIAERIVNYTGSLLAAVDKSPDEALTEQNAHNVGALIFFDVQLEDDMKALGMPQNDDLVLAVNRLKSLQKLYLFEQKGGENYLAE